MQMTYSCSQIIMDNLSRPGPVHSSGPYVMDVAPDSDRRLNVDSAAFASIKGASAFHPHERRPIIQSYFHVFNKWQIWRFTDGGFESRDPEYLIDVY